MGKAAGKWRDERGSEFGKGERNDDWGWNENWRRRRGNLKRILRVYVKDPDVSFILFECKTNDAGRGRSERALEYRVLL
jgi:hypothetical protein